jgi:hypothetical protein
MENEMNVTLVHPEFGAKVATNDAEIADDEKNGWTRYNPDTPVEAAPIAEKPVRNKLTRKVTDKPVEQPNEVPSFLTSASDESEGN